MPFIRKLPQTNFKKIHQQTPDFQYSCKQLNYHMSHRDWDKLETKYVSLAKINLLEPRFESLEPWDMENCLFYFFSRIIKIKVVF